MQYVCYKPFDPTSPTKPLSIVMSETGNIHDEPVILCRAQIRLLRALIPRAIRNTLDTITAATGIHVVVLPSNLKSTFIVHFSNKVAFAEHCTTKYHKRGVFPCYYYEKQYSSPTADCTLYCASYDETTDEFIPSSWWKDYNYVAWLIQEGSTHADTGLPIFTTITRPHPMAGGHRVYYFEMGKDAFSR